MLARALTDPQPPAEVGLDVRSARARAAMEFS
jgi:hypothetical protein